MPSAAAIQSFPEFVEYLRATRGDTVRVDEIATIMQSIAADLTRQMEVDVASVGRELGDLVAFISRTKTEIAAIQPHALSHQEIPGATDQLDAIVQNTEEAAGKIMDCAEQLGAIARRADDSISGDLLDIATRIFEASSFQDLTGQRVTKVIRLLKHIEGKLGALAEAVGDTYSEPEQPEAPAVTSGNAAFVEKDHLDGPALEGSGNNQDDIDALLASFD